MARSNKTPWFFRPNVWDSSFRIKDENRWGLILGAHGHLKKMSCALLLFEGYLLNSRKKDPIRKWWQMACLVCQTEPSISTTRTSWLLVQSQNDFLESAVLNSATSGSYPAVSGLMTGGFKHVLFFHNGLSSFPLTNSYFSRWWEPPIRLLLTIINHIITIYWPYINHVVIAPPTRWCFRWLTAHETLRIIYGRSIELVNGGYTML